MAKKVSPDKGNSIEWYRDNKVSSPWQQSLLDQVSSLISEAHPGVKGMIKWSQPVWESPEGPIAFARSASKHFTVGFWRGAEMEDPAGKLEGEGDRMKHLKFKSLEEFDRDAFRVYLDQAIALNASKGDPTKGK